MSLVGSWLKYRGFTQLQLAQKMGVSRSSVQQHVGNDYHLRKSTVKRYAEALGITPDDFLAGPPKAKELCSDDEYSLIRFYEPGVSLDQERTEKLLAFPTLWIYSVLKTTPDNIIVIRAAGDSMSPCISDNDALLVDKARNNLHQDGIYVFQNNSSLIVKRIELRVTGEIVCKSDNPAYENYTLNRDTTQVYGRVVWIGRTLV